LVFIIIIIVFVVSPSEWHQKEDTRFFISIWGVYLTK